ncbi:MAG TPA: F0F1 ATP synthase subunit A [Firmicutes bacterium]|nr:F0F1 ATP synthase subunit A [Bacillota bacterium]
MGYTPVHRGDHRAPARQVCDTGTWRTRLQGQVEVVITTTITVTWAIMAIIIPAFWQAARYVTSRPPTAVPDTLQNSIEFILDGITAFVDASMGAARRGFVPYIGSLAIFLVVANLTGLIGVRPPSADLSTTLALATLTFLNIQYYGLRAKGLRAYIKGFFEPIPLMLPLNIISSLALPFSMAFRLFGNLMGGSMIMGLIYRFAPLLVPVLPHMYFDLFAGLMQTFIFTMLTMTFIADAMG